MKSKFGIKNWAKLSFVFGLSSFALLAACTDYVGEIDDQIDELKELQARAESQKSSSSEEEEPTRSSSSRGDVIIVDKQSSSSNFTEVPMTSCLVKLSTNVNSGLDFSSCTAVPVGSPADITFAKVGTRNEPELSATAGAGVFVTPITNGDLPPYTDDYEVDMWPEDMNADRSPATAYVSDFKFNVIESTQLTDMIQNSNQIYVARTAAYNAETGAGFYAFAITEPTEISNGDFTFTVKLYMTAK